MNLAIAGLSAPSDLLSIAQDNERLRLELRSSRIRLVDAADAERIRIERNLHDGAQQQVLSIAMKLRIARGKLDDGQNEVAALLDEAMNDLLFANEELRALARGVLPAILTDHGLAASIEAIAARSSISVVITELPVGRLPQQVETTAYFVVAEAIANAIRHSESQRVLIEIKDDNFTTSIEILDEGIGGADPLHGSGLHGLADRVAALDGRFTVISPIGAGTVVRASLCRPRPALVRNTQV